MEEKDKEDREVEKGMNSYTVNTASISNGKIHEMRFY